jgi:hypothetical protein
MDTCTTTRPSTAAACRAWRRTLAQTSHCPGAEPRSLRSWRANGVRTAAAIKPKSRRRSARLQIRPARGRGLSGRRLEHLGRGQLRTPAASNSPVGPQPARGIGSTSDLTQAVLRTKQLERHPARSSPALGKAIDVKTTGNGSTEAHLRKLTRRRRGPLSVARAQVAPTHNRAVVADGAGHRARGRGQSNEPAGRNGEHSTGIGTPAKQCAVSLNTTRVLIGRGEVAEARACGWHRRAPVVMSPTDGAAVGKETARMGDARGHFDKMVQRRGRGAIANAVGLTVVPDAAQHASGRRDGLERKDRHTDRRKCGAPAQHGPVGKLSADGVLRGDEVLEVRSVVDCAASGRPGWSLRPDQALRTLRTRFSGWPRRAGLARGARLTAVTLWTGGSRLPLHGDRTAPQTIRVYHFDAAHRDAAGGGCPGQ